MKSLNRLADVLSNYFAHRKGLIPLLGVFLVMTNFVLQFFPVLGWVASSNLLLHLGVILAILGIMLAWAL